MSIAENHPHYYREIGGVIVDFYRLCEIFDITHPAQAHALKKIMFAGQRPDEAMRKDIIEASESLERWIEMLDEDAQYEEEEQARLANPDHATGSSETEGGEIGPVDIEAVRAVSPRVAALFEKLTPPAPPVVVIEPEPEVASPKTEEAPETR